MSFLKSVFLGSDGTYNILGTKVEFQDEFSSHYVPVSLEGAGLISKLASKCINSNPFRWITQGYTHVFVHEMSHVLACRLLIGQNSEVYISTSLCAGKCNYPSAMSYASNWKQTVIDTAGSVGDIAFATCKLVAATAMKSYLSWPVALALGSGAVIWMSGELLYGYVSASNRDHGDFGFISRRGNTHLALATTALVSQVALGIFLAIKFAA